MSIGASATIATLGRAPLSLPAVRRRTAPGSGSAALDAKHVPSAASNGRRSPRDEDAGSEPGLFAPADRANSGCHVRLPRARWNHERPTVPRQVTLRSRVDAGNTTPPARHLQQRPKSRSTQSPQVTSGPRNPHSPKARGMVSNSGLLLEHFRRSATRRLRRTVVREDARRSPCSLCNSSGAERSFASPTRRPTQSGTRRCAALAVFAMQFVRCIADLRVRGVRGVEVAGIELVRPVGTRRNP